MWNAWTPLDGMHTLHRELDRFLRGHRRQSGLRTAFLPGRAARQYPLLNVSEDAEAVYVQALAPGLKTDSIAVTVQGNTLSLAGEKAGHDGVEASSFHRSERAAGRFHRTLELQTEIDETQVSADYRDGILSIRLPKDQRARARNIKVSIG